MARTAPTLLTLLALLGPAAPETVAAMRPAVSPPLDPPVATPADEPHAAGSAAGIAAGPLGPAIALATDEATDEPTDEARDDGSRPKRDPRLRSKRRLLRLGNGQVLRGDAKLVDDQWEVATHSGTVTRVPAGFVTEDLLEKDVLREMRGRASKLRKAGATELAAHARWMFGQGLLKEGFEQVDELLAEDPDQAQALELLADHAPLIGLPPIDRQQVDTALAIEELLDFAARAPVSLRELAVLRLREVEDADGLHAALVSQLYVDDAGRRAFATLALRRLDPARVDEELAHRLLVHTLLDRSPDVRRGASLALRDTGESGLTVNLIEALGSRSTGIRTHAAEALGHFGPVASPLAVEPLVNQLAVAAAAGGGSSPRATTFIGTQRAYVAGFDADVAQNAAIADPIVSVVQEGAVLDAKALGVSTRESVAVRTALTRITGADPGNTRRAWESWFEEHRGQD